MTLYSVKGIVKLVIILLFKLFQLITIYMTSIPTRAGNSSTGLRPSNRYFLAIPHHHLALKPTSKKTISREHNTYTVR